jgi:nucleotide-binding universal stress UspA family protein
VALLQRPTRRGTQRDRLDEGKSRARQRKAVWVAAEAASPDHGKAIAQIARALRERGEVKMADFKRILVPTDFTETSEKAIEWALSLAERLGSWVTLMHAYEIPIIGFPDGALVATADIATRIADASRAGLDSAVGRRQGRKVKVDGILRDGVAWEEINRVGDEIDADLIVIGTHGRRGLARALLGSVAENVVRTAHRPILTIHGPREK